MKHLTRRMKKVAPLALLGLLMLDRSPVNQPAQALVGGPFDDNAYFGSSSADGTYSATLSGKNLIGMVSFGVSSSTETVGRFSVFHEGFVNYGSATGAADLQSRRLFGSLLGVAALGGDGLGTGITETTGGSGNLSTATQTITVRSSAEGAWNARMKGYPQVITFEGEGELSSAANNAIMTITNNFTGSDFVVTTDFPAAPATDLTEPITATDVELGGQIQVAQLRTTTPFKVRGSRTSRVVYTAITSYASVPPIAGGGGGTPTPTPAPTPAP
jgi:hypothetical protein